MNKTILIVLVILPLLVIVISTSNVYTSENNTKRYNDGCSNGSEAAAKDSAYNPACDPTGAYTSDGQYTTTYCDDWAKGYAATWNAKHRVQPTNPDAPSNNDNSGSATNFEGSQGNYAGIWQTVQPVLLQSCDTLVNPDGSLTSAGTSALGCIRNRIVLDGGAALLGVPLHVVLAGLSILAAPISCGGIVDMSGFNRLSNIGSIGSLLSQLP